MGEGEGRARKRWIEAWGDGDREGERGHSHRNRDSCGGQRAEKLSLYSRDDLLISIQPFPSTRRRFG